MFKRIPIVCLSLLFIATTPMTAASQLPFDTPDLPDETRSPDLISRLTLQENIDCPAHKAAVPRLGVQGSPHIEGYHGVAQGGPSNWGHRNPTATTQFPQAYGLGETWDPELIRQVAAQEALEARYLYQSPRFARSGLIVRAPNADLARDPRWGRTTEAYGEDPYLVTQYGLAQVRGIQGEHVVSTLKHFAVYSIPKGGRDGEARTDPQATWREIQELHLAPFRAAVRDAGALGVMASYNDYDGVPVEGSRLFLTDILRGEYGFKGYVVSDSAAVEFICSGRDAVGRYSECIIISSRILIDTYLV